MDAGVIASVRARHLSVQRARTMDFTNKNISDVHKFDILTAKKMLKNIWNDLPSETIKMC